MLLCMVLHMRSGGMTGKKKRRQKESACYSWCSCEKSHLRKVFRDQGLPFSLPGEFSIVEQHWILSCPSWAQWCVLEQGATGWVTLKLAHQQPHLSRMKPVKRFQHHCSPWNKRYSIGLSLKIELPSNCPERSLSLPSWATTVYHGVWYGLEETPDRP